MNEVAILERLVPASDVFELLAREYDRRDDYENFDVCKKVALEMLLARLKDGFLDAWSTACSLDSTIDTGGVSAEQIVAPWDYYHREGMPAKVPREFWAHYHYAGDNNRSFDPLAGDFRFAYTDEQFSYRDGSAYAIFFDPKGLPGFAVPSWHGPIDSMPKKQAPAALPPQAGKGRPPANWWPAFAEELAFHIHENGAPKTQEALIEAVFDALAKQGKPEPSRTQIQPVIRQLFERLGRAGK